MSRLWLWLLPIIFVAAIPVVAIAREESDAEAVARAIAARALRQGDKGAPVAALQRLLQEAGFDPGKVDGIFGPLTEAAVRQAQAADGGTVDGLAGRETVALLAAHAVKPTTLLADRASRPSAQLVLNLAERPAVQTEPQPTPAPEKIALTFNGTPDPALLPAILAALEAHRMQATFFVTGEMARRQPDLLHRIVSAGHELGNAGPNGQDMTRLPGRRAERAILETQEQIRKATGRTPTHFRPPLGRFDAELVEAVARTGLSMALWTNVTAPVPNGPDPEDAALQLAQGAYPGAVLMLHQDRPETAALLDRLLSQLATGGYRSYALGAADAR